MIAALYNKHAGQRAAIVASGPTATLYHGDCDLSIAVNGAALLPHRFSYFMCGDHNSHLRDWFRVDCADQRIIGDLVATHDKIMYPSDRYPRLKRRAVPYHLHRDLGIIPSPISPHLTFRYKRWDREHLRRHMKHLMFGGTVTCCALQLAWLMGCKLIDLYGSSFDHSGGAYFYHCDKPGSVSESQRSTMQQTIDILRQDVQINIIGRSLLT